MGLPGSVVRSGHAGALIVALAACHGGEPSDAPGAPGPVRPADSITEPLERYEDDTEPQRHLLGLARTAIDEGRAAEARVTLQTLSETRRRSEARAMGVMLLASLERDAGDAAAATQRMLQLRVDSPADAAIEHTLGRSLEADGRVIEAEAAFRRATRIRPDFLPPWAALTALLDRNGRNEDADEVRIRLERHLGNMHHRLRTSESETERVRLIEDLARWTPDERVSRALVDALRDEAPELRILAAIALRTAGTPRALPALRALRERTDGESARSEIDATLAAVEARAPAAPPPRRR